MRAQLNAAPSASASVFTFAYNQANQRIGETATDKNWGVYPAAAGNTAYTANNLDQYAAVGAVTPTYDGNGNLTFDGAYTLVYDAEDRLVSASGGGNTATYAYDAQGRRKSKTVNGTTTLFVTDADNREVLEYSGATGQVLRWYAYGLGPNEALNQIDLSPATRATFIPDIQGSFQGTLDSATGTLTKAGYQPFGQSATVTGTFRYTGQRIDAETGGLYYYRARMYSPALGRFLQTDPIGTDSGVNLYAYVGNDPINLVDPTGLVQRTPGEGNDFGRLLQSNNNSDSTGLLAFLSSPPAMRAVGNIGLTTLGSAATLGGAAAGVAATLFYPSSTADSSRDEIRYVVRGGAGASKTFETGTALTQNGYGFSVQTAPGVSVQELAKGGRFPNAQISVSTVHLLQKIPGVVVRWPTPGAGDYHGTVNIPYPPPAGIFNLISSQFQQQRNPFPVPR